MKRTVKKLVLKRETVRALQDADLRAVVGGGPDFHRAPELPSFVVTGDGTCSCPAEMDFHVAPALRP
jgi:hypothetical protein